jgi:hypothetical protein
MAYFSHHTSANVCINVNFRCIFYMYLKLLSNGTAMRQVNIIIETLSFLVSDIKGGT